MPDLVQLQITGAAGGAQSHERRGVALALIFQIISLGLLVGGLIGSCGKLVLCLNLSRVPQFALFRRLLCSFAHYLAVLFSIAAHLVALPVLQLFASSLVLRPFRLEAIPWVGN